METESYGGTFSSQSNGGSSPEDVKEKVQTTASSLMTQATEVASAQAASQMTRAADALDSVARTLHESGSNMTEQQPQVAQLAREAANRVDQVSGYLREHDLSDVISEAEQYARREPAIFLGAAFALGFVAARFLKAGSPNGGSRRGTGYTSGYDAGQSSYAEWERSASGVLDSAPQLQS